MCFRFYIAGYPELSPYKAAPNASLTLTLGWRRSDGGQVMVSMHNVDTQSDLFWWSSASLSEGSHTGISGIVSFSSLVAVSTLGGPSPAQVPCLILFSSAHTYGPIWTSVSQHSYTGLDVYALNNTRALVLAYGDNIYENPGDDVAELFLVDSS